MTNDSFPTSVRKEFFYTFVQFVNKYGMGVFISAAIIVMALSIVICLVLRDMRYKVLADRRLRFAPWIFLMEALIAAVDLLVGGDVVLRIPLDLSVTIIPVLAMSSSVWPCAVSGKIVHAGVLMQGALLIYHVMVSVGVVRMISVKVLCALTSAVAVAPSVLYLASLVFRIRDVKTVMKSGTVWLSLSLAVESIYVLISMLLAYLVMISFDASPQARDWLMAPVVIMSACTITALGLRLAYCSTFVFCGRHEKRIIESMKISHVEICNSGSKDDMHFNDIYERVVSYFQSERPYLNSELTINDVVKVVFTNKLYISKAISMHTGRNFCQFVNYYRVTHSVDLFRKNPEMKVVELAVASGFNSVVSYNMAFRLFMSETPSDWCRKERQKLIKGKNKLWNH